MTDQPVSEGDVSTTWERGRGRRGIGRAVITVTHKNDGFVYEAATWPSTTGLRLCGPGSVMATNRHKTTAVWRRVERKDNSVYTSYFCDGCMPAKYRPGSPECEAANQAESYAGRRPKLTDADKLHRYLSKIGGFDGIAEGHYAVVDPHDPERVTRWRVKNGAFEAWPVRVRVGPIADINWRADRPRDWRLREQFNEDARAKQRAYLDRVKTVIRERPHEASARYARMSGSCCMCGRALSDAESVGYGIGPECRKWMPAADRAAIADFRSRRWGLSEAFTEDGAA